MHKAILHAGVAAGVLSCGLGLASAADDDKPAPDAAAPAAPAAEAGPLNTGVVIVTGTRASGLKVENSASPIQVLDTTSLQRTGQPDLLQALAQNLPSLTAQAFGSDMANMTLSARLTEDSKLLQRILQAEGWYDGAVQTSIERAPQESGGQVTAVADGPRVLRAGPWRIAIGCDDQSLIDELHAFSTRPTTSFGIGT